MSTCKFCGKNAGLLRSSHEECQKKYDRGIIEVTELLAATAKGSEGLENSKRQIDSITAESHIGHNALRPLIVDAFESAVNRALSDDFLSQRDEDQLVKFTEYFGLTSSILNENPAFLKMVMAATLRDIMEGKVPNRVKVSGNLPFNFQKSEQLVWLFQEVEYLQPRTRTSYQGKSAGVSIRVAKGLYFRTGQFSGRPIVNTEMAVIDIGDLAITDKQVYFAGQTKSFRAKHNKIVSFTPYSDGISIQRDGLTKPDIFKTGNGWFIYNLLMNLSQFELA